MYCLQQNTNQAKWIIIKWKSKRRKFVFGLLYFSVWTISNYVVYVAMLYGLKSTQNCIYGTNSYKNNNLIDKILGFWWLTAVVGKYGPDTHHRTTKVEDLIEKLLVCRSEWGILHFPHGPAKNLYFTLSTTITTFLKVLFFLFSLDRLFYLLNFFTSFQNSIEYGAERSHVWSTRRNFLLFYFPIFIS